MYIYIHTHTHIHLYIYKYVDDLQLEQKLKDLFHCLLRAAEQTHELSSQVNIFVIPDHSHTVTLEIVNILDH